jgi:hypothetical protein
MFGWSVLFSWGVVAWTEAVLLGAILAMIGIGYTVQANNSGLWFTGAQICFSIAALLFLLKVAEIAVVMNHPFWERAVFTIVLFGVVGLVTTEGLRCIYKIRPVFEAKAQSPPNSTNSASITEDISARNNDKATAKVETAPSQKRPTPERGCKKNCVNGYGKRRMRDHGYQHEADRRTTEQL